MNSSRTMQYVNKGLRRFDALSLRERLLVLATVLVVLHFLWDGLLWQPLQDQRATLNATLEAQMKQLSALGDQAKLSLARRKINPDKEANERLLKLQQQLREQRHQAEVLEDTLITPARMAKMLEQMLNREAGLTLVRLRSLESEPLFNNKPQQLKKVIPSPGMVVYKHSFEIEFEGDYFSTLKYLKELRKLPWRFFWKRLDYKVSQYPYAAVKLRLYTLSLSKEWLGV